ncbi:probable E3 ubiquitin-protein ligase HERC4 [Sardina pilchardus]|uniref:probable E3 ubiquitin-protein ligase HERC4 n=1 Tax=Sardina pilchardus TaxID=27697 RepID=UPI002E142D7E
MSGARQDMKQFVVLHFNDENEVEAAPSKWLEWGDGANDLDCYWPPHNPVGLAKKNVLPDKQLWTRYRARILSQTDTYAMARHRARKAQDTSQLEESDHDSRRVVLPQRFREDGDDPRIRKPSKKQQCKYSKEHEVVKLFEGLQRRVMMKLEMMEDKLTRVVNLLNECGRVGPVGVEEDPLDIFQQPLETVEGLDQLCHRLQEGTFRKKTILLLPLLPGFGTKNVVDLSGGQVFSWGQNKYGQLGLGMVGASTSSPQVIQSLLGIPFSQVAAGGAHSFALTFSGGVFGWGRNKFGQLGLNDSNDRHFPVLLKTLRSQRVVYICCGEDHTAALTKEGGVFTFGAGGYGQLGHNSTNHEINPRKVFELMGNIVTQIACGRQHTLAFISTSGKINSFGLGGNGQLGTRSTCNRKSPALVKGPWRALNNPEPDDMPSDSEQGYYVRRIFAGGDQSFAHFSTDQVRPWWRAHDNQNDLAPVDFRVPDPRGHIHTLSADLIQKWLSHAHGRLPPEISNEIDVVFSSASCLNGSFLSTSHPDHYNTSSKCSGVDMNTARILLHRVVQPDYPQISQLACASLEKTLLPRLTSSPPDIEALRLYLTLPECSLLHNPSNYASLTIPLASATVGLKEAAHTVLCNWWSRLEPSMFQRRVELYKEVVLYLLRMQKVGVPPSELKMLTCFLHHSLKLLGLLHAVNEAAGQIIQYDKFYIHELDELIDIRNDYINWIQQQVFAALMKDGSSVADRNNSPALRS